jgi:hypothetical protein
MESKNRKKDILENIQDFEQNLHFKGSINLNNATKEDSNIFERLGLTTSIGSVLKDLEQSGNIKVLSPFPQRQNANNLMRPSNMGAIPSIDIAQTSLDPTLKRIRFINSILIKVLIFAIIVNFILIFIL